MRIREVPVVGIDSYNQKIKKNADGTIDLYFSPKPPTGQEANWITTTEGKPFFLFFRFYGPEAHHRQVLGAERYRTRCAMIVRG
jgi:hypothetical protein